MFFYLLKLLQFWFQVLNVFIFYINKSEKQIIMKVQTQSLCFYYELKKHATSVDAVPSPIPLYSKSRGGISPPWSIAQEGRMRPLELEGGQVKPKDLPGSYPKQVLL